jgi:hypothetical protein
MPKGGPFSFDACINSKTNIYFAKDSPTNLPSHEQFYLVASMQLVSIAVPR